MSYFTTNVEARLLECEPFDDHFSIECVSLEEVKGVQKMAESVKGWEPHILGRGLIYFIRHPFKNDDGIEEVIRQARLSYRKQHYDHSIGYALSYLKGKSEPSYEVYALIGLSYLHWINQIADNYPNKKEREKRIESLKPLVFDYLKLYNYFSGKSDINEFDFDEIESELKEWMDNQKPIKAKREMSLREVDDLDLVLLKRVNDYIKGKKKRRGLTIEKACSNLKFSMESIDKTKLSYARMAIRAKLPHIAEEYIKSVERTPNKTDTIKLKLAEAKRELRFLHVGDELPNREIARLVAIKKDKIAHECPIIFVKPGKRKTIRL